MEYHPMITVSNQVCLAKMATRGLQEGIKANLDAVRNVSF
jgi:hypothetical protein